MTVWWERYPWLLDTEKRALEELGCVWKIDAAAFERGSLRIDCEVDHEGRMFHMLAEYPGTYPYFPPHVVLLNHEYARHQNPTGKNLCLLAREGRDWEPGNDTLAGLLKYQFPVIHAINTLQCHDERVVDEEDRVGEALSSFVPAASGASIIVPDDIPSSELTCGQMDVLARPLDHDFDKSPSINGMVSAIRDRRGTTVVKAAVKAPAFKEKVAGFWLRLPDRPSSQVARKPKLLVELMSASVPEFVSALNRAKAGHVLALGFVYPDELGWRQTSDDWLFLCIRVQRPAKRSQGAKYQIAFLSTDWGGPSALIRRAPALKALHDKSVFMIGLGSIGSPMAMQLARAGVKNLDLLDCDSLQVGNTIRWALGWEYAAAHKATAMADHIAAHYPYTQAKPHDMYIGGPNAVGDASDYERLRCLAESSDLIVDASANHRVSHFLSDLAKELEIPFLWLTTTHGAAGGVVGRVIPKQGSGCWQCFQYALADESIPLPADTGAEEIQPGGCSQATFIGAGVDSDEVAILASRLAVATLAKHSCSSYPDFLWNVAIGSFLQDGHSIAPEWKTSTLPIHSRCRQCNP